jgi:N-acetylglucosaminyldiphosphoundecaprenol N-acetyl-beta-D-mannosaminyltransferase
MSLLAAAAGRAEHASWSSGAATFDFFSGRIKQAPRWIRDAGFERLYQLTKDFRRLWLRYIVYNAVFLVVFAVQTTGIWRVPAAD